MEFLIFTYSFNFFLWSISLFLITDYYSLKNYGNFLLDTNYLLDSLINEGLCLRDMEDAVTFIIALGIELLGGKGETSSLELKL
jgi:hypothetical protein